MGQFEQGGLVHPLAQDGLVYAVPEIEQWSQATIDAAHDVDQAEAVCAAALERWGSLKNQINGIEPQGSRDENGAFQPNPKLYVLVAARDAAGAELDEASESLVAAKTRHRELVFCDEHERRLARQQDQVEAEKEARHERHAAATSLSRHVLAKTKELLGG